MLISVVDQNGTLDNCERDWIERRIYLALGRFTTRIEHVTVALANISDAARAETRCRVRVVLTPNAEILAEDTGNLLKTFTANALDRAARFVALALERQRDSEIQYRFWEKTENAGTD